MDLAETNPRRRGAAFVTRTACSECRKSKTKVRIYYASAILIRESTDWLTLEMYCSAMGTIRVQDVPLLATRRVTTSLLHLSRV